MTAQTLNSLGPEDLAAWRERPNDEQRRLNRAVLDRHVVGWDELVAENALRVRRQLPLIFLHVPKTGGTTLTALITRTYPAGRVTHVNAGGLYERPEALASITGRTSVRERPSQQRFVVMGHHRLNDVLYQLPCSPFAHVTMLRDPVRRVLSHYNHMLEDPDHKAHQKAAALSLEEYVSGRANADVQDGQVQRLSGCSRRRDLKKVADKRELLELAQANLEQRFSFFGLTERFDAFLILCQRLLGWPEIFYVRKNVRRSGAAAPDPVSPEALAVVAEYNRLDAELHAWALELFDARCAALGVDDAAVRRFAEANARFNELVAQQY